MVLKYRIVIMKRSFLFGLCAVLFSWTTLLAQGINELNLFETVSTDVRTQKEQLQLNLAKLRQTYEQGLGNRLSFHLPLRGKVVPLTLQKVDLFHPSFQLLNARGERIEIEPGRHYQAFQGDTLITLSLFPTGLQAQMHTADENLILAANPQKPDHYYWSKADLPSNKTSFSCHTPDEVGADLRRSMMQSDQSVYLRSSLPPLTVYFEMDHFIYLEQGQDLQQCVVLMAGLFNAVAQVYRLEGIGLQLKGLKIWDQPDPFSTEDSREALFSFRGYLPTVYSDIERDWDIEFLLSRYIDEEGFAPHGGLANINSLCDIKRRQAYANIGSSFQYFPNYSWSVFVIAHEIGHTIASPHSHNCYWPEGALDDCYCPEGSCEAGPSAAAQGGGTIMSYCYLTEPFNNFCQEFPSGGNSGVNFLRAFGQYPGNLMRQRLQEKDCLRDRPVEQLANLQIATLNSLTRINDTLFVEGLLVQNTGTEAAPLFRLGVFQGTEWMANLPVSGLAAGDSILLDFELLLPLANRDLSFSFQLDILQEVVEWHEGDNYFQGSLQGELDFPVISLVSDSIWIDTDYYFIVPNFSLQNKGWARSGPIIIKSYLLRGEDRVASLFQQELPAVEANRSFYFSIGAYEPSLGLPSGDYQLQVELLIGERRELYLWPRLITIRGAFWEWFRK